MVSSKILSLAVFSFVGPALAQGYATIYSQEPCTGESAQIPANKLCTPVPLSLYHKVTAVSVPENVVCEFYKDLLCLDPLLNSVEDPGICKFSEWDTNDGQISNQALSILCYALTDEDSN
ncbi:hypothetical protein BDV39DRAFT_202540 [Aspergillus sergii]|uniref:Uncharacterized protein n=1 Tax=Aspergillus sergii TaxID=1034303 RepID=A0A5N6XEJ7_9EURO|nr:hypothetical protein BDV39DRAFT_202540 [Aspergillus sergii]